MGDTNTRLPVLDPLLAQSARDGIRVRLVLRQSEGDAHPARIVEGIVLEAVMGRDNRTRLRMGIPTGSGDPVEVRVLLQSIERVERVDAPTVDDAPSPRPDSIRRPTLAFGSDHSIRRPSKTPARGLSRNDTWDDLAGVGDSDRKR